MPREAKGFEKQEWVDDESKQNLMKLGFSFDPYQAYMDSEFLATPDQISELETVLSKLPKDTKFGSLMSTSYQEMINEFKKRQKAGAEKTKALIEPDVADTQKYRKYYDVILQARMGGNRASFLTTDSSLMV